MNAQHALGMMYDAGRGVEQSYTKAADLYLAAAEQGHIESQVNLGVVYVKGKDAVQDYIKAHMWFNIAAAQGNRTARDYRDRIAKRMMPKDISTAQRLARSCLSRNYVGCNRL